MNYTLYSHVGSLNHGCEALVRSTVKVIGGKATLFSTRPEEDALCGITDICDVRKEQHAIDKLSWKHACALFQYYLKKDRDAFDKEVFSPVVDFTGKTDFFLSIGGDNYCYGVPQFILLINRELRRRKAKTILWGCSIEPSSIEGVMLEDLGGYSHIYARESVTYNALLSKGIQNVSLLPDPAFQLDLENVKLPEGFVEGNTVGINVSPMIISNEKQSGVTYQNYSNLVKYIIENTDMQVALIPHVVWPSNDDREPLKKLFEEFRDTDRVILIDNQIAPVLKGIISHCRFLITARTHASIAAYSTQVPTLVVGYSVKARGIATDIFGTEEHYVVPVQSLTRPEELTEGFKWLMAHEQDIKKHYSAFMPDYIGRLNDFNITL